MELYIATILLALILIFQENKLRQLRKELEEMRKIVVILADERVEKGVEEMSKALGEFFNIITKETNEGKKTNIGDDSNKLKTKKRTV